MKYGWIFLFVAGFVCSCNDSASVTISVDSTGKKFEEKAEKVWDTTKEGLKDLKEAGKEKLENLKDKADQALDKIDSAVEAKRDSIKAKRKRY
jgi:ElaB/YqjD/DUF883 family membrane-anchored ribosome-binding protein